MHDFLAHYTGSQSSTVQKWSSVIAFTVSEKDNSVKKNTPPKVMQCCIPLSLQKKKKKESAAFLEESKIKNKHPVPHNTVPDFSQDLPQHF